MLIKKTGSSDYPKYIKALIMGPPKSGKTSTLSTFPNIVIADVEAGLMSIAHKNTPYVDVDDTAKLQQLLMVLGNDQLRKQAAAALDLPDIESVGIDTLDALQELLKKERMRAEKRTTFQREDWGWLLEQMSEIIKGFLNLPLHVAFTVHTTTTFDDESRMIYAPGLQGAIQDKVAGLVGFSMFSQRTVEVDPASGNHYTSYKLLTEGDAKNPHLGNRAAGALPRVIEPDFKVIFDAVYANIQQAQQLQEESESVIQAPDEDGEVAQSVSHPPAAEVEVPTEPVQQPAQAEAEAPAEEPQGTPSVDNDEDDPITANGVSFLTTAYKELGIPVPEDLDSWTLGKGRMVGQWINSCKADWQQGTIDEAAFRAEVLNGLKGMNAIGSGEQTAESIQDETIPAIKDWVGDDTERARQVLELEVAKGDSQRWTLCQWLANVAGVEYEKPQDDSSDEETEDEHPFDQVSVPAEEESTSVEESDPLEAAEERLKQELGAVEVDTDAPKRMPFDEDQSAPCEECGGEIDDPDIARLSNARFGKWLCVSDYMRVKN